MIVDFDPAKDASNIAKHGVSLAFGVRVMGDARAIVLPTIR